MQIGRGAPEGPGPWGIEGSWIVKVAEPNVIALHSYFVDGTALNSNPNPLASPGHGAWIQTGPREYATTIHYMNWNTDRHFIGTRKVRRIISLDESGDTFTGRAIVDDFDTDGNLVRTLEGPGEGRRVRVERL